MDGRGKDMKRKVCVCDAKKEEKKEILQSSVALRLISYSASDP